MTKEELKELEYEASVAYQERLAEIYRQFCLENNPYKVGDIIKDYIGYARIKRIIPQSRRSLLREIPCCTYDCENLTKKLTVNKREPTRAIWQHNIITD